MKKEEYDCIYIFLDFALTHAKILNLDSTL